MADDLADETLIEAAVAGDRLALSQLLYLHHRPLTRFLAQKAPPFEEPLLSIEDVVQETYLRAFRDIRQCKAGDDREFSAWLRAIGGHQLQNALKAARAVKRGGRFGRVSQPQSARFSSLGNLVAQLADDGERPSQAVARRQAAAALQVSLANLPDDQRCAVELRYLEGKPEHEVAATMGRSRNAVHGLVVRARSTMRELLGHSSRWFYRK